MFRFSLIYVGTICLLAGIALSVSGRFDAALATAALSTTGYVGRYAVDRRLA